MKQFVQKSAILIRYAFPSYEHPIMFAEKIRMRINCLPLPLSHMFSSNNWLCIIDLQYIHLARS